MVNSTTGQPVPNAKIKLTIEELYGKPATVKFVETNAHGEAYYSYSNGVPDEVYVSTNTDKACPSSSLRTNYEYEITTPYEEIYDLFTDREIYRPGQTVHASVVAYSQDNKTLKSKALANKSVSLILRDANDEDITSKEVVTDEFGTASADFELPKNLLTGDFAIYANSDRSGFVNFKVEEYKRPTFTVDVDEYKEKIRYWRYHKN